MILVAGGTGTLGRSLIPLLTARGESVRVLTRDPGRGRHLATVGVEMIVGDVRDREVVGRAMAGVRTVVSAIQGFGGEGALGARAVDRDGNANLIDAAEAAGVEHFVLLSIQQASPHHPIELFRMKATAELRLKGTRLSWTIVRPTAYQETWLELVGRPLVETGRTRVFGRGRNPINFVSASDVARVVELAVVDPALRGVTIDVCGPENLTVDEVVAVVKQVTGADGPVSHVPLAMMRILSVALRPFKPVMAGQIAAAVVMDTRDMTADATERTRRFPSIPATSLHDIAVRQMLVATEKPAPRGSAPAP